MNLEDIKTQIKRRPWWMNAMLLFCAFMTFIYLPWDVFIKPLAEDQEVWFGILFTGWPAKIGAVVHWFVYGAGTWGFLKMKPWMHPWAALYVAQIAFGMGVWSALNGSGSGLLSGLLVAAPFAGLSYLLVRHRARFNNDADLN